MSEPGKVLIRRAGATLLGIVFAVLGAGLAWLPIPEAVHRNLSYAATLIVVGLGAFISLFGVSTAWQSARGEPAARGFFARWLMAVSVKITPDSVLLAVVVLAVGVISQRGDDVWT